MTAQSPVVRYFLELAAISSPSFKEKPIFDYIQDKFNGKDCHLSRLPYTHDGQELENMLIRLPATNKNKKALFFDAHADTVPPCDQVTPILDEAKGIIHSGGLSVLGADDKAGIAAMLAAIDEILEQSIDHGELLFVISSAEEVGLIGARYLPASELQGMDYGFILDSGGPVGIITLQAPYHYNYRITVKGRAAHAGMEPEKGIHAIRIATQLMSEIPCGRISEDTVANIGTVCGGAADNVVADTCYFTGEFRSLNDAHCQPIVQKIQDLVQQYKKDAVDIICTIEKSNDGYHFTSESPIAVLTVKALADIGIQAHFERSTGGTNANIYTGKGITSTVISVGMEKIHTVGEYIRIQDLEDCERLLLQLIKSA